MEPGLLGLQRLDEDEDVDDVAKVGVVEKAEESVGGNAEENEDVNVEKNWD